MGAGTHLSPGLVMVHGSLLLLPDPPPAATLGQLLDTIDRGMADPAPR